VQKGDQLKNKTQGTHIFSSRTGFAVKGPKWLYQYNSNKYSPNNPIA